MKTILIVENDAATAEFLVLAFAQETSHHTLLAPDGLQALKLIRGMKPHLFILDYRLPDMNAIELYDQLHATTKLEATPTIVLCAYLDQHDVIEIEKRKIAHMNKPFSLDDFLDTVEKILAAPSQLIEASL